MSKQGAAASRSFRAHEAVVSAVRDHGFLNAAGVAYEIEKNNRVAEAMRKIVFLAERTLGITDVVPYVIDDFLFFDEWLRVCIEVEGVTLNFRAATGKDPDQLNMLLGKCSQCHDRAYMMAADSLWQVHQNLLQKDELLDGWRCSRCKGKDRE